MTRTNKILVKVPKSIKKQLSSIINIPKINTRKLGVVFNKLTLEYVKDSANYLPDFKEVEEIIKSKEKKVILTLNYDDMDYEKFMKLADIECRSLNKQAYWILICISLKFKKEDVRAVSLLDDGEIILSN